MRDKLSEKIMIEFAALGSDEQMIGMKITIKKAQKTVP